MMMARGKWVVGFRSAYLARRSQPPHMAAPRPLRLQRLLCNHT